MATFDEVKQHDRRNIRKALGGSVFVKPWEEGDEEITSIWTGEPGGLVIPAGYQDVGLLRKSDAVQFSRDIDSSDVESWGNGEPTRRDITKRTTTMRFVMQESKRLTLELYNDTDYSGVTADTNGNVVLDDPALPRGREWRAFTLAKDGDGADAVYFMRALPNCQVTDMGELTWGEEDEIAYEVTLTGFNDPAWGTSVREIWGGPGLDAADLGFGTTP